MLEVEAGPPRLVLPDSPSFLIKAATMFRRWILPVAPLGMLSEIKSCSGTWKNHGKVSQNCHLCGCVSCCRNSHQCQQQVLHGHQGNSKSCQHPHCTMVCARSIRWTIKQVNTQQSPSFIPSCVNLAITKSKVKGSACSRCNYVMCHFSWASCCPL